LRALIVSDVHSNLEAFQAVINDAEARGPVDEIWSLGDLIGYGPDPAAVMEILMGRPHQAVAGNHDLASVGKISLEDFNQYAYAANKWTSGQLSAEQTKYIEDQEIRLEFDEFTMVHGSPRDPVWEYVVSQRTALASFRHFDTFWCLLGHSHIPFICHSTSEEEVTFVEFPLDVELTLKTNRLIINPGSVGQPRDGDPRASFAVYDSDRSTIVHHRVEYDIRVTQDKMRAVNLPAPLVDRLSAGQ
jgi:predicted phosphodiesterase